MHNVNFFLKIIHRNWLKNVTWDSFCQCYKYIILPAVTITHAYCIQWVDDN